MSMIVRTTVALIGLSIAAPHDALAQAQGTKPAPGAAAPVKGELMIRVYPVTDLVTSPPDYPYRGSEIPTTSRSISTGVINGSGLSMGYGGGGMGGGVGGGGFGGGGFFQVSDAGGGGFGGTGQMVQGGVGGFAAPEARPAARNRFTMEELIAAIEATIEPNSWVAAGGDAVCTPLGGMLIVKQTTAAHKQIEDLLLAVRADGGGMQTLTVQAHWLLLTRDQVAQLLLPKAPGNAGAVNLVDGTVMDELAKSAELYSGQITCFNEQTVHLVSGDRRLVVTGAVPVVSAEVVGYQPVLAVPNIGVLLELTPRLRGDDQGATVDLESTVTALGDERTVSTSVATEGAAAGGANGSPTIAIDRLSLVTQHLATTIGLPVGQPVLVGGLSAAGGSKTTADADGGRQLYLVVKLAVNRSGP